MMVARAIMKAAAGAVRPWQSLDAEPINDQRRRRYAAVFTSQSEIDRCLACPLPACNGCRKREKERPAPAPQIQGGYSWKTSTL